MKKISFLIVIFICMADAALAVTQEGGLFYLPEDTTMQHKDSTVQKRTFSKDFWTILMMLIKIRIIRNLILVLLADHITVRIPNWGLDWWQRGFIVLIEVTCFFPVQCIFIWRCFHCWLLYVGDTRNSYLSAGQIPAGLYSLFLFLSFQVLGNRVRYG